MRDCQFRFLPLYCNNLVELRRALAAGHPVLVGLQIYQRSFMQSQGGMIALPDPVRYSKCMIERVSASGNGAGNGI